MMTEQPNAKVAALNAGRDVPNANVDVVIRIALAEWAGHDRTTLIAFPLANTSPAVR